MKIKYKLSIALFVSLATIVSLGTVSYSGIKEINAKFDELVQPPIPSILRLGDMTESFLMMVEEAHSYRLYGELEA